MEIVLGVSMTPSAVRMVLVEGEDGDGPTVDRDGFDLAGAPDAATSDTAEQVVAAILGTRESALEGGHRLVSTGVAWTDHQAAAELRKALRGHRLENVVLVSELHAASALAQAVGLTIEADRTALMFLERDTATLAVVRTVDGAVVRVQSRSLQVPDPAAELRDLVDGLEQTEEPPQAVFMVGSGVDVATWRDTVATATTLPVHAPEDAELALARGAALASAATPRYEASTVGLAPADDPDTAAGMTQLAAAGYMAPLGYSAVDDEPDLDFDAETEVEAPAEDAESAPRQPFFLVGSALTSVFVVGVIALAISLAVSIRPTVDQRPDPGQNALVPNSQAPVPEAARPPAPAPETIQAPIPVVQEAPRPVVVAPRATPAPAAVPAAPAPPPVAPPAPAAPPAAPAPAAPAPVPVAPAPAPVPAAPAPYVPPIVVAPIIPPLLPPFLRPPVRTTTVPQVPTTSEPSYPSYPTSTATPTPVTTATPPPSYPTYTPPVTTAPSYPTYTAVPTTQAPSYDDDYGSGSSGSSSGSSGSSESSGSGSSGSSVWPLWPFGGR